jgi:ADP-ribose pyrophosphatase
MEGEAEVLLRASPSISSLFLSMNWQTLSRKILLSFPRFLTVESHTVQTPTGQIIEEWSWVATPDYINVAIVTAGEQWLCFRQTKYGYDGLSLAPVGGYIEAGETPLAAAQREVLEETGYRAETWVPLGSYRVDANRGAGNAHLFLATGAVKVTDPTADDLEPQEVVLLSRAEVEQAVANGEFKVLAWAAVMALGLKMTS